MIRRHLEEKIAPRVGEPPTALADYAEWLAGEPREHDVVFRHGIGGKAHNVANWSETVVLLVGVSASRIDIRGKDALQAEIRGGYVKPTDHRRKGRRRW